MHALYITNPIQNRGAWFDTKLNMLTHINNCCSSAFFHLYNIRRIRKYLHHEATECLIHAFISSKIDYCNSLLYGLPACHISKLKRVQNVAARLVTAGSPRFCHTTLLLESRHWLPVQFRIHFTAVLVIMRTFEPQRQMASWGFAVRQSNPRRHPNTFRVTSPQECSNGGHGVGFPVVIPRFGRNKTSRTTK